MTKTIRQAEQLLRSGRLAEAADLCRRSIKLQRDVPTAKRLLADCLYNQSVLLASHAGLYADAEPLLREAIQHNSAHAHALNNLGSILLVTHRVEESIQYFTRAAELSPSEISFLGNLAKAQEEGDHLAAASQSLHRLAKLDAANGPAYLMRDALLVHAIAPDAEYPGRARARTLEKLRSLEVQSGLSIRAAEKFPSTYFLFSYHGICNVDLNRAIARIYLKACPSLYWVAPHVARWQGPRGRIRLGIVSGFFRVHSIGSTTCGLVQMIDRNNFEVVVIRLAPSNHDEMAEAIDRAADVRMTVDADDLAAARQGIAKLELDVLFYQDIGMEPLSYFLALARLAPVQLTSFGHPDTTGIPTVDYFLSSENYEREGAQDHYSERLVTLPNAGTLSYYRRPPPPAKTFGRDRLGLSASDRIYCCPQMLFKIQPVMDRLFAAILDRDPSAVFVMIETAQRHLRVALERRMVGYSARLGQRIRFIPVLPHEEYLSLLRASDVILDTVHFNGQNTSLEAFAMGVPVVTLPGTLQRGRHTYGMYLQMGFLELAAASEEQYVKIACRIANDRPYRDYCRQRIESGCAGLFESIEFVRNCEGALARMVEQAVRASAS